MVEEILPIPSHQPSFEEISSAIARAEYGLSLMSLDLLQSKSQEYFHLAPADRASCILSVRNALSEYRRQHEALEDGPNYFAHHEILMKKQLEILKKSLHDTVGESVAMSIFVWLDHFSVLSRQGGYGMAWSSILLSLRDRENAVVLRQLGISSEAVQKLAQAGHAYSAYFDEIDTATELMQQADKSAWDQQEFRIYQGDSGDESISLLVPLRGYLRARKRGELLKEIDELLNHEEKKAFRQWAEMFIVSKKRMSPHDLNPPSLYKL